MKRFLSWIILMSGVIFCPFVIYAAYWCYSRLVGFVFYYVPFVEYIYDWIDYFIDDAAGGSISALIAFGAATGFMYICAGWSSAISESRFGMRYFVFNVLSIILIIAELSLCAFSWYRGEWVIMNSPAVRTLNFMGYRISVWVLICTSLTQLFAACSLPDKITSEKILFGKRNVTVFFASPSKFFRKDLFAATYHIVDGLPAFMAFENNEEFTDFMNGKKAGTAINPLTYIASKEAFVDDNNKFNKHLLNQILTVAEKSKIKDFIMILGKALPYSKFRCEYALHVHIDPSAEVKTDVDDRSLLCALIANNLKDKDMPIDKIKETLKIRKVL